MKRLISSVLFAAVVASAAIAEAQQPVSRLKGRVTSEKGEPLADAEIRIEAFFGPAAGTFAGQRTYEARTNAKGESLPASGCSKCSLRGTCRKPWRFRFDWLRRAGPRRPA